MTVHRTIPAIALAAAASLGANANAQVVYASGQFFDGVDRVNRFFEIDLATGEATPASPPLAFFPQAGLAGTPDGRLIGIRAGTIFEIDPADGTETPIASVGVTATSLDVLTDGRVFTVARDAFGNYQQLFLIDIAAQTATPLGSPNEIGDAIDIARGTPLGTAEPFVIALGSVGPTVYAIDADSGTLVAIDPDTGDASVVGVVGAITASLTPRFTGLAALTGADTNGDGEYDTLISGVNFDNDFNSLTDPLNGRFGGVAAYNLATGEATVIGNNSGIIFFGMGAIPAAVSCRADLNNDGVVDADDFFLFLQLFADADPIADINGDGVIDADDFFEYLALFAAGCP